MDLGKYRFASGDPLILQHEAAFVAWRIDAGEIEIRVDGAAQRQLGEGELLGEEIVLNGGPAPYSAFAKGIVKVSPIDKTQLETIFKPADAANDTSEEREHTGEAFAEGSDVQMGGNAVNAFAAMAKAMERQTELLEIQHRSNQSELDP